MSRPGVGPSPDFDGPAEVRIELLRQFRNGTYRPSDRPLAPGETAPPVTLAPQVLGVLYGAALGRVLGVAAHDDEVIWSEGGDELAVSVREVAPRLDESTVVVVLSVRCDESGPAEVEVVFAVGAADRPAGMFVATEERPRGPAVVVDRWADALTAWAWSAILDLAQQVAATAGRDAAGDRLVAAAMTADKRGLSIVPFARHRLGQLVR